MFRRIFNSQQTGLVVVIIVLCAVLAIFAGSHTDRLSGRRVNNFLNSYTLMQTATDASFFAIMAVGATMVIITGGVDLSVGSTYALAGVTMALVLRKFESESLALAVALCVGIGLAGGLINGLMVVGLKVHPFIITLGMMWVLRGIAFVASQAESILVPDALTRVAKANFGLGEALYPVPMLLMLAVTALGAVFLSRSVPGRYVYAVGGNIYAARYSGVKVERILVAVYTLSGLCAGIAAFIGTSYYGSASCGDATGYELYVIASAVVGGASLSGGKGSAINAMLGAVLIVLIRVAIRQLHFDQNYEWVIIGCAIIIAVVLDQTINRGRPR
jgi:ribose/xylose/arabinose/galactoside ABC-type transport system permease subunit